MAILADEGTGTTFVDLTKLTLNDTDGTYTLPASAVAYIDTYQKYDNLGIESTNHLVMMGKGYGGTSFVVAKLKDPAVGLGFDQEAVVDMPVGSDDQGNSVTWSGGLDPHASGAYITPSDHPTYTTPTSLGFWMNNSGDHVAIIDLQGVLDGVLSSSAYDPEATTPLDIAYFSIPNSSAGGGGSSTSVSGSVAITNAAPASGNQTLSGTDLVVTDLSTGIQHSILIYSTTVTAASIAVAETGGQYTVAYSFEDSGNLMEVGCGSTLYSVTTCAGVNLDTGSKTVSFSNTILGAMTINPTGTAATLNGTLNY